MRAIVRTVLAPGAAASVLAVVARHGVAWAQAATPTAPVTPSTPAPAGGEGTVALTIGLLVGLVALVVVVGKFLDLRRKREAESVHVQAQISDALLREPDLFGLPLTPVAHVPVWRGSPARVDLTGCVPDEATHDRVLRIVRDEARRIRPDIEIEDRLTIDRNAALPRVA